MDADVSVIGLGRVGLPLALSFADRGLRVVGVDRDSRSTRRAARGPDALPRGGRRGDAGRVAATGRLTLSDSVVDAAAAEHIVLTVGTPSFSHIEIDVSRDPRGARRAAAGAARRPLGGAALDDRPGHDGVRRRLPGQAPRLRASARTCSSPTRRSGSRPAGSSRRSTRCRASSAASARSPASACGQLFEVFDAPIRQTTPGPGRAGQDLDQHPALHPLRAAQPPDDGLRAVRRQRLRGHRPDQPRLPPRRHRAAGPDRRNLPAQGLRVLRGALARPGDAAGRLARQRVRAAVPRRGRQAAAGRPVGPQGRRARAGLQGRHRRRARLAGAQADATARARAGRRGGRTTRMVATPTQSFDDAVSGADAVVVATNHARVLRRRAAWPSRVASAAATAWSSIPGTAGASGRSSPTPPRRWRSAHA